MSKNLHFSSLYSRKRCEMRERFAENSTRVKDRAIKTRTICIFCAFNYHLFLAKFMIWRFLLPPLKFISSIKRLHWSIRNWFGLDDKSLLFFSHLFLIFAYRSSSWTEFSVVYYFSSFALIYSENSRLKQKTRFTSLIFINIHNTLYSTFSPCQFNDSSSHRTLFP